MGNFFFDLKFMSDLPPGWIKKESTSHPGKFYYFNTHTQESSWEKPSNMSMRCSHLLVKHADSRRPASWKSPSITRTKEEAIAILKEHREKIMGDADPQAAFAKLAKVESDCSSAKSGGDLGFFGPGEMQKPFEDATKALNVGEISGVVDTASGVHIILRTG